MHEPAQDFINTVLQESPSVVAAIQAKLRSDHVVVGPPRVGDVWRVGDEEALMVWVRRVFEDSAAVIPVTFDEELADDESLIIPADDSPLGIDTVLMASVEAHVDFRSFLQPLGSLRVEDAIEAVRRARQGPAAISEDLQAGPPVTSESDQRLEYRQVLADLLADLSPAAFAADDEAPPVGEGLDLYALFEQLRELTWRRAGLNVDSVDFDHVAVDAEHELIVVATVEHLDAIVVVAVLTGTDPPVLQRTEGVAAACGSLLQLRRYQVAEDVAVVIEDDEWTTIVVDATSAFSALEVPSGLISRPRVSSIPLPLADALLKHLDVRASRWDDLGAVLFSQELVDVLVLARSAASAAVTRTAAEGRRATTPPKKTAYSQLGEADAQRIVDFITAVATQSVTPADAVGDLLGELDR